MFLRDFLCKIGCKFGRPGFYILTLQFCIFGCAHNPTYTPEIGAIGTRFQHGGVVYSIPVDHPVLKMKLVTAGVTSDNMLSIRVYFVRKGPPQGEYMISNELAVVLPDSEKEIGPNRIHASGRGRPMIRLAELPKQAIELLFPLPEGPKSYPYLTFKWKIHYFQSGEEKVLAQSDRFDLNDPHLKNGVGFNSPDMEFPIEEYSTFPPDFDWIPSGWLWW